MKSAHLARHAPLSLGFTHITQLNFHNEYAVSGLTDHRASSTRGQCVAGQDLELQSELLLIIRDKR